jgi:fumarylacetoacetase
MAPLRSWLSVPNGCHFSIANIPFGIVSTATVPKPRVAVAIGEYALDLEAFAAGNGFARLSTIQPHQTVFSETTLNAFAALGRPMHRIVREYLQSVLLYDSPFPDMLKENAALQKQALVPLKDVKLHLPFRIGDYTDFYAGINHAYNVGVLFRGPENALQPNYKYLPVGYHGRASSVFVSGTPIVRPNGQVLENPASAMKVPTFTSCRRMDMELELGAFLCRNSSPGQPVRINEAGEFIFGLVLMNDWSARDIQAWEYVPLGPFNSKNFGTSISAWVVTMDALEPFMAQGLENDKQIFPYLQEKNLKNIPEIRLEVRLKSK